MYLLSYNVVKGMYAL